MSQKHWKITTAKEYLEDIVEEDFADLMRNPASLRIAFHSAFSLYHLHEFVFADHGAELSFGTARAFDKALCAQSPNFQLIRDIANTAKHMSLTRDPQKIAHISNVGVEVTGMFGEAPFGTVPFGGSSLVRVFVPSAGRQDFQMIASSVLRMWRDLFSKNGW